MMTADDFLAALPPDLAAEVRLAGGRGGLALLVRLDEDVLELVRLDPAALARSSTSRGIYDRDLVSLARLPLPEGPPDLVALDARRLAGPLSLAALF